MSFFGSIKKISLKKVVATVKKTVKDSTTIASGVATGGVAGGLSAVGSLSKSPTLTPTTVYGPDAANLDPGTVPNVSAPGGSNTGMLVAVGVGVLLLFMLLKK